MASRIVWWVLTLGILAVIHLPVTKGRSCRFIGMCLVCKYAKATKDHCIEDRKCYVHGGFIYRLCNKHDYEEKRTNCGIKRPSCYDSCMTLVGVPKRNEGEWPWQVSLQTIYYDHMCGGVLIDKDWVLTAANCVHKTNAKDLHVALGEFDLKRRSGNEQFRKIKHIIVHPKFQSSIYANDVALIQLEKDAHYNEYVSPICIASADDVYASKSCAITGWEKTRGTGDRSRFHDQRVNLLSMDDCKTLWPKFRQPDHMCVMKSNPADTSCIGDSGGPLSCVRKLDGRFILEGVASFDDSSCRVPVYTNIRTYLRWINNIRRASKHKP